MEGKRKKKSIDVRRTGESEHAEAKEKRCDKVVGSVQICFYSGAVISRAETKYPSGKYTLIIT